MFPDWFDWYGLPSTPHKRVVNFLVTLTFANTVCLFLWFIDKVIFHIKIRRILGKMLDISKTTLTLLETARGWALLGKDFRQDVKETLETVHKDLEVSAKKVNEKAEEIKQTIAEVVKPIQQPPPPSTTDNRSSG